MFATVRARTAQFCARTERTCARTSRLRARTEYSCARTCCSRARTTTEPWKLPHRSDGGPCNHGLPIKRRRRSSTRTNPVRPARRGVWAATVSEAQNTSEVGTDVYTAADDEEDNSVHSGDISEETGGESVSEESEPSDDEPAEVEPTEDILALLPEQRMQLWEAAEEGDEHAVAERRSWRRLRKQGALTTHGTVASSSEEDEDLEVDFTDDPVYDLLEGADRVTVYGGPIESSHAVESRSLLEFTGDGWTRPLQLEPDDHETDAPQIDTSGQMPPISEYVPIEEWHPSRFVFDTEDRLVLPPGRAAAMYAFITQAREVVQQFGLDSAEVQAFVQPPVWGRPASNLGHGRSDAVLRPVGS